MKLGSVKVSGDLLRNVLRLPDGTRFLGAGCDIFTGDVELQVTHPDLRTLSSGERIPIYCPTFNKDGFIEWGDGHAPYKDKPQ